MREHDRFGFPRRKGGFELIGARVECAGVVIDEDRHGPVLDDRRDRGRKTGGARDHFVTGTDAAFTQLVAGERGNRQKVCRRSRIDQQGALQTERRGQLRFKGLPLCTEGEPEIERRADGGFHFVRRKNASGVWNTRAPRRERKALPGR
jgi:hypothetical protein